MKPEGIAILSGLLALAFVITVLWLLFRIAWAAEARAKREPYVYKWNQSSSCDSDPDLDVKDLWKP